MQVLTQRIGLHGACVQCLGRVIRVSSNQRGSSDTSKGGSELKTGKVSCDVGNVFLLIRGSLLEILGLRVDWLRILLKYLLMQEGVAT